MGDLPGVMVAAFAVAIFASGILIGRLWRMDRERDWYEAGIDAGYEPGYDDGYAQARWDSRSHVRCVPRPFDHAEDGL